jgi:hypothetical protein
MSPTISPTLPDIAKGLDLGTVRHRRKADHRGRRRRQLASHDHILERLEHRVRVAMMQPGEIAQAAAAFDYVFNESPPGFG